MKQEGYILLINDTDYDWLMSRIFKLSMCKFCFPECIRKQSEAVAYIVWEEMQDTCSERLAAAVSYELSGTESSFMLMAYEEGSKKDLRIYFENMAAKSMNDKVVTSLGWVNGGTLRLLLSRPEEGELHRLEIDSDYGKLELDNIMEYNDITDTHMLNVDKKEYHENLKEASKTWFGTFTGMGSIDNLYLKNDCYWDECEIILIGYPGEYIKCTLTLIIGGELTDVSFPEDIYLKGEQEEHLSVPIGQKTSVVLAGTVKSLSGLQASVDITLRGRCKEK